MVAHLHFECKWWFRLMAVTFLSAIIGLYILPAAIKVMFEREPVKISRAFAMNSPVTGDILVVRVERDKFRSNCVPVTSIRWATDQNGVIFDLPDKKWNGGTTTTAYLIVGYDVSKLPNGIYTLHVVLEYPCNEGVYTILQPTVTFRVRRVE